MAGAAQEDMLESEMMEAAFEQLPATGTDGTASAAVLRSLASERLAAHRRKRAAADAEQQARDAEAAERSRSRRGGVSRVRDAVAARYEGSVSYHEFLAQEAERALMQAQAEAEVAARNAEAVAQAQLKLLDEIEQYRAQPVANGTTGAADAPGPVAVAASSPAEAAEARHAFADAMAEIVEAATEAMHLRPRIEIAAPAEPASPPSLTVRLFEDLNSTPPAASKLQRRGGSRPVHHTAAPHEHAELDDEIAFRRAPEFEAVLPPEPITVSGNLIEFPRQLVATKKARPRIAEGPLREDGETEPQLRIFEVEAEQAPVYTPEPASAPEWQSILLEASTAPAAAVHAQPDYPEHASYAVQTAYTVPPQTAPMQLRLMALTVDGCAVATGFVAFVSAVAKLAGPRLEALPFASAAAGAGGVLVLLAVCYQMLFFTLSDATPGMRYARIGLCTFGDTNPTRHALRRRVLASVIAACPLGLGLLWMWMDEDGLGWHDRISRMYQRAY